MRYLLLLFLIKSLIVYSQTYTYENKYGVETIEFLSDTTFTKNYYSKKTACSTPVYYDGKYLIKNDSLILNFEDYDFNQVDIFSIEKKNNSNSLIYFESYFKDQNGESIGPIWGEINGSKICSSIEGKYINQIENKQVSLKLFSYFDNKTIVFDKKFQAGYDYKINFTIGKSFIGSEEYKIHSLDEKNLILYSLNKKNKRIIYKTIN